MHNYALLINLPSKKKYQTALIFKDTIWKIFQVAEKIGEIEILGAMIEECEKLKNWSPLIYESKSVVRTV